VVLKTPELYIALQNNLKENLAPIAFQMQPGILESFLLDRNLLHRQLQFALFVFFGFIFLFVCLSNKSPPEL